MKQRLARRLGLFGLALCVVAGSAAARADVAVPPTVRADFELSFEPNTPPFNMDQNNPTPFQPFQAFGILTFTLSDEVNNPAASTVPYTNVTGELYATDDSFYISPVEFLGGSMTNVVRNSGVPVSGTVEDLSMRGRCTFSRERLRS